MRQFTKTLEKKLSGNDCNEWNHKNDVLINWIVIIKSNKKNSRKHPKYAFNCIKICEGINAI